MNQATRRTVQTIHGFLIEEPSVFLACSRSQPDEQALFFEKGSHQRDRGFCRFLTRQPDSSVGSCLLVAI